MNPFDLTFGIEPKENIERKLETNEIISTFNAESSPSHVYMLTGVRGSGKTVLLTSVSKKLQSYNKWIIVDVNPLYDIEEQLAAKLYDKCKLGRIFTDKTFGISFNGISFSIKGSNPVSSISSVLEKELSAIKDKDMKVLVTLDEATNNKYVRKFAHTFQSLLREDYPIYLIMTGLYHKISDLQNEETLTFLYRSPRIELQPLELLSIKDSYKKIFNVSEESAVKMAKITNGYALAYQILGSVMYDLKENEVNKNVLSKFDLYIRQYSYDKILSSLSNNEKKLLFAFGKENIISIEELLSKSNMSSKMVSVYRDRLIKQGILKSVSYGVVELVLPRFSVYLNEIRDFVFF